MRKITEKGKRGGKRKINRTEGRGGGEITGGGGKGEINRTMRGEGGIERDK